jgi:hypothetical protein
MGSDEKYSFKRLFLKTLFFISFFPFVITYFILVHENWIPRKKIELIISLWVLLLLLIGVSGFIRSQKISTVSKSTEVYNTVSVVQPSDIPIEISVKETQEINKEPNSSPQLLQQATPLEKINTIVLDIANVTPTVYSEDNFANEMNAPYNIVVNLPYDHSISSCAMAKNLSVEVVKSLFGDIEVRNKIDRVIVTVPYYLRMSLGSDDGIPMAENDAFGGPSLYWETLEKIGLGEREVDNFRMRTWGVYLDGCN